MEKYSKKKKDLYMVFINLEKKSYDRVPKKLLLWVLQKKDIYTNYVHDSVARDGAQCVPYQYKTISKINITVLYFYVGNGQSY